MPDLALIEALGKMPTAEIDEAMVRFGDGEGDVLLTTNIIEAGLDVPFVMAMIGAFGGLAQFGLVEIFIGPFIMAALLVSRQWLRPVLELRP